jgi:FtsP/CotA-like multicopper oxidase with cupredoxin domain
MREIALANELPVAAGVSIRGLDGVAAAEPLLVQPPIPAGGKTTLALPLRQSGTFLLDGRLSNEGGAHPLLPRALVVEESKPPQTDRDEVLLIEDWRLKADGTALMPGQEAGDATPLFTANRLPAIDITLKRNERLRLRMINGCQRAIIALKIADLAVRVMAIDSEAAEPFVARDGQIVLAPGTRVDALIDATAPAGTASTILLHDGVKPQPLGRISMSNDAPARDAPLPEAEPLVASPRSRIDLKSALRVDLTLDAAQWSEPAAFDKASAPVLRAARGRTIVLAITNNGATPATFHLHGHHFRLLDRLDDGWKPFWLDTLAFQSGQTQRIAFAADFPGRWLMETMGNGWSSPRKLRWYEIS